MRLSFVLAPLFFCVVFNAYAGEDVATQLKAMQDQLDRMNTKLETQQKTIEEQKRKIDDQQKVITNVTAPRSMPSSPAAELLRRIEKAEDQSAQAVKIASRKKPNDSNMSIGAAVDTAFRYFDGDRSDAERPAGNDFSVRGAEIVFYADVDKFFKSYLVLNAVPDAEDNDEAIPALEEAAIYTTSLSHVQVKGGRFFVPFGRLSSTHEHDLPFVTRPGSLENYVGGESGGDGVQVQALLPIDHFLQITAGVFNKVGSEFPFDNVVPTRRNAAELTYMLKALTSFNIGEEHSFEWGVTSVQVPDHLIHRNLNNMEFTYRWHPTGTDLRERLVWGTEVMHNEKRTRFLSNPDEVDLGDDAVFKRRSFSGWGGYSYVEYFYDKHWSFGPRVDVFQPVAPEEAFETKRTYDQTYSLFATYKFTEFSRLRAEISRHEFSNGSSANEFYLQWTVFWGAHTHSFDQR